MKEKHPLYSIIECLYGDKFLNDYKIAYSSENKISFTNNTSSYNFEINDEKIMLTCFSYPSLEWLYEHNWSVRATNIEKELTSKEYQDK